ncbi:MAG: hypothetical protein ACREUE_00205 [Panacagrimonas sp.]
MAYQPKAFVFDAASKQTALDQLGYAFGEFTEIYAPDPDYAWGWERRAPTKDKWKLQDIGGKKKDIPTIISNMMKSTWKTTEPKAGRGAIAPGGKAHGQVTIGQRGMPLSANVPNKGEAFHPQVRPTKEELKVQLDTGAIAKDWNVFDKIPRVSAVTFRGDQRPPGELIGRYRGFSPPSSRTDQYYLENYVYPAFASYLKRRWQREDLSKQDFLHAVNTCIPMADEKKLLVDYMMWRQIVRREEAHLGRMTSNECLKGYISTSKAIDSSIYFGTAYHSKPGWLYVTVVEDAFIVPFTKDSGVGIWKTGEAEIAQWGPVPADRVIACARIDRDAGQNWVLAPPFYMRKAFRRRWPRQFEYIFKVMSGAVPPQV